MVSLASLLGLGRGRARHHARGHPPWLAVVALKAGELEGGKTRNTVSWRSCYSPMPPDKFEGAVLSH